MKTIQLVYAQSITRQNKGFSVQELEFAILVKNLDRSKKISVHWAGDDNLWRILPAKYNLPSGRDCEQWLAKTSCSSSSSMILPGNIRFALQYAADDREHWDNNNSSNYLLKTDAGVLLGDGILLAHTNHSRFLPIGEIEHPVEIAVHKSLRAKRVFVRWTIDNWTTFHQSQCSEKMNNSSDCQPGPSESSQQNFGKVWSGGIRMRNAADIQYAFGCETAHGEIWENNFGVNYAASRSGLKILTLNLHCYQEDDQEKKFREIARAIHEIDIDIVCLQEVGEDINDGKGNWQSNAAKIIQDYLLADNRLYHLYTDISHIGFDLFFEGSAILSKFSFVKSKSAYVSSSTDIHSIHSRKVVMVQIHLPEFGHVNLFSVHLSWWKDGFWPQFEKLWEWAENEASEQVSATLLCGDFNTKAGSHGYMLIADSKGYEDQFLHAASPEVFAKVFRETEPDRDKHLDGDGRIDFIFARKGSMLKATKARVLFSGGEYKKVSDHPGYLTEFYPV